MTKEGDLLWSPDQQWVETSNLKAFMNWLSEDRHLVFDDYQSLWHWSVTEVEDFWGAIWDYFELRSSAPYESVLPERKMPGADWFGGAQLNYAEHVLSKAKAAEPALFYQSELTGLSSLSWEELSRRVQQLAREMRCLGVQPGDCVVALLPNVPHTLIAFLATASIGAVWASCSPDFGAKGILDRVAQLSPTWVFFVEGYQYGGRYHTRQKVIQEVMDNLSELKYAVRVPYVGSSEAASVSGKVLEWDALLANAPSEVEDFQFTQVSVAHPLWVLFSSGTTGLPKAIMHGHGGILLEMHKLLHLMMDFKPGERVCFYTTTGWMMWNFLVSALLVGAVPVLYDGHPAYPTAEVLWRLAQESQASFLGASPSYVNLMEQAGVEPGKLFDLSHLRAVMPAGAPVSPECTAWFYDKVKRDLWVATGSGGTDCCTGFVGGVSILPVYAGEMQAPALGVAAASFDEHGNALVDQMGELVITEPLPSMPVGFWGDEGGQKYQASYFDIYPGVWRHGDLFRINQRGGCFVLGRSDATLNRHGVRIGTAEIYAVLQSIPEVDDALVVSLDLSGNRFFMPLFVQLCANELLDEALAQRICQRLRAEYTPRHVPDRVIQVPAIPLTATGKRMEVPVRKLLMGAPVRSAYNPHVMRNPDAMDFFINYAREQKHYVLEQKREV